MQGSHQTAGGKAKPRAAVATLDRGARRAEVVRQLVAARAPARTTLRRGCVVWASIPFAEDASFAKTRPAVVAGVQGREVRVLPLTSSVQDAVRLSNQYVRLQDWVSAGLSRPCRVWRHEVSVDLMDVTVRVGELSPADRARVLSEG